MNFESKLVPIKADASFRKFYRKKIKKKSSIIVYAEKEKIQNLLNYDSVNKLLLQKNINAPRLLSENFNQNLIEIDDLGTKTILDILKKKNTNKLKIYKKILVILIKLQKIKLKKIKNFKKKFYKIPIYSNKLIFNEANLFLDWYIPKIANKNKRLKIKKELKKIITSLIKKIQLPNTTFVHRDFHVSNLMIKKNKISVIDSQDAVYGNIAYDLASLIDDVRLKTSKNIKEMIYQSYLNLNKKKINKIKFKNDFEILSVLRNLKIIGIFTRLAIRDKKKIYLKLIPYAWNLIELRLKNNVIFKDLKYCLDVNFSKKIRLLIN
jgi:aminoglycoside/choline kinase family phosphotransferase